MPPPRRRRPSRLMPSRYVVFQWGRENLDPTRPPACCPTLRRFHRLTHARSNYAARCLVYACHYRLVNGYLRSIKTLEQINGKPAAEFWERYDKGEFK